MEKFDKTNPYNPNKQKQDPKKLVITIAILIIGAFLIFKFCFASSSTIGKYTKEELPKDFAYTITKDESDAYAEKNQLYVQLSQKLTEGQIATLAEELYNSKEKQRRFYIFYSLKKSGDVRAYWAKSDFDPELQIEILGSTQKQENQTISKIGKIDGNIIGSYYEEELTSSSFTVYENNNKTFIKSILKDGQATITEMNKSIVENGTKLNYIDDSFSGEYFILTKENNLEFYNKKNEKFTTGYIIK